MADYDKPTSVTQNQVGFAPQVAPYAEEILGRAQGLATQTPYQAYQGEQVAQFSPLQQQSYDYATQMQSSPQLQDATAMAGQAGLGALNTQYTFNPSNFDSATATSMMNPYMQNVVDVQSQQAKRQAAIQNQGMQAQAANAGAFGGGRDAIMRAQSNAELQRNLQGIQATGLNNAYTQAMNQYNTQNQQNAQQQQFGASLGMQGLGLANQAAQNLGALGQTQYAQNLGIAGLQNQMGLQQQQQAQNVLNTQYQNYLNEQNDPYKKLGFYSDIVRGAPLTQTGSSVYSQPPSSIQNLTSLGLGAYGLSSLFGGQNTQQKAAGGAIKGYAGGGSVMSPEFKRYAVDRIDPRQLQLAQRNAIARGDRETAGYTADEMAEDAALRRGVAAALPQGVDVVRAAGGGILAFAMGGDKGKNYTPQELIRQSMETDVEVPDAATRKANIKTGREGLAELYGESEVDPMLQEDAARRQAAVDAMDSRYAGLTALRMAAALQKSGVNDSDRWGGAFGAAAEGGEKAMTAKTAAQNELYKAKLAGAAARQARKDGFTDKAAAREDEETAHRRAAAKLKSEAAGRGAQTLATMENARTQAFAAGRPTDLDKQAQAIYEAKVTADPTIATNPKAKAAAMADARKLAADQLGRFPGSARIDAAEAKVGATALDKALESNGRYLKALQKGDYEEAARIRESVAKVVGKKEGSKGSGGEADVGAITPIYATNGKQRIVSTDNGQTWNPVGAQ